MWPFDIIKKKREQVQHKKKIIILCSSIGTVVIGGTIVGVILALPKPKQTPLEPSLQITTTQTSVGKSVVKTTTIQGTFEAHNFSIADLSLASDSTGFTDLKFYSSTKEFSVKLNPSDTDGAYDL
jgi:hypothetical protein